MSNLSKSIQEERYRWYVDRVAERRDIAGRLSDHLDLAVITLASSALALSATFIGQIKRSGDFVTPSLLAWAWCGFVMAIICNILSRVTVHRGTLAEKKKLDAWLGSDELETPDLWSFWESLTSIFNVLSMLALLVGLILLPLFAWNNIMSDETIVNEHETEKTWPILNPPILPNPQPPDNLPPNTQSDTGK